MQSHQRVSDINTIVSGPSHYPAFLNTGLQDVFMSCCNLKIVQLKRCVNVDDSCISILAKYCRGLSVLNIHGCHRVGDGGLASLADRSQYLESLDLTRTAVSGWTPTECIDLY